MKKVLISLACLVVLVALYACGNVGNEDLNTAGQASGDISFERITPEALNADLAVKIDRSRNSEGYEIFTSDKLSYIVVYAGQRPTSGYSIEITSITVVDGKTHIKVKETSPSQGDVTAQVITYPYDVAKLDAGISGSVEIEYIK